MINLLPSKEKINLREEENWKLTMIIGILILIFLISFSLILFSIKFFIEGEVEVQKILFNQREKEFQNPQMQSLQANLISFNQTLFQLESFYQNQLKLTENLEKISKTLPLGIYLTNLSIKPQLKNEGGWQLGCNLSGYSPTREVLLEFKKNLEEEERFQEVYFPPANWVQAKDINFTVSFVIK